MVYGTSSYQSIIHGTDKRDQLLQKGLQTRKKENEKLRSLFPHWPSHNCISCKMPGHCSKGWWDLRGQVVATGIQSAQRTTYFTGFQPAEQLQHRQTGNRAVILRLSAEPSDVTSSFPEGAVLYDPLGCRMQDSPAAAALHCCSHGAYVPTLSFPLSLPSFFFSILLPLSFLTCLHALSSLLSFLSLPPPPPPPNPPPHICTQESIFP